MSKFAPPSQNGESPLKFGIFDIQATEKATSTGGSYFEFLYLITPYEPTEQVKQRKFFSFSEDYRKVIWPSLTAVVPNPDDVISMAGEPSKHFYASYRTPKYLIPASSRDLEYAKNNNRMGDMEANSFGQLCKPAWPVKFEKVFATQQEWMAAAEAHKAEQPAPPAPDLNNDPDYLATLSLLPVFIANSGLNLDQLKATLQNDPFAKYGMGLEHPEVKKQVALAVIQKAGPTDKDALKGILLGMNGYLDIESPAILDALGEIPF